VRILHVVHRYPPAIGGGEGWCAGLARWQAAQGHEVRVLTLRALADDDLWGEQLWGDDMRAEQGERLASVAIGAEDHQDGVRVRRCSPSRPLYAVSRLLSRAKLDMLSWGHSPELYGLLLGEARRADVVHAYWLAGPHVVAAWLAARASRRAFVLTPFFHEGFEHHESRAARWLLRRPDQIIALTRFEMAALQARGVAPERLVCASNAVEPPAASTLATARARVRTALDIEPDVPLLCYLGRKGPNKGLDQLLLALRHVEHRPRPLLAVAGPSTAWYRKLRHAFPDAPVRDLPLISETAKLELLAASDLLVLPSRHESFGTVFLEAWAVGTPVLGADIPAVREVIGDAGLTFRRDDPYDLAAQIDAVLGDPAAARDLAERGRERSRTLHTWDRVGTAVLAAYEAAQGARHAASADHRETSLVDLTASVVIPTRNRCGTLQALLDAVVPQASAAGAEVVVVDNGSTDGTGELLRRRCAESGGQVRVVVEPTPGATRTRNAGARAARGAVLAFIDDDALPRAGWLAALLAPFARERVGAAGGRVVLRFAGRLPPWWDDALAPYLAAYDLGGEPIDLGSRPAQDAPRGLNMAVRRDALLAVGGFDVRLGPRGERPSVGEESDLCQRLIKRGYQVCYTPAAAVDHVIDPGRLEASWLFRRAFWTGWSEAMVGLAHQRLRKVAGLVRWHYRLHAFRLPYRPRGEPDPARLLAECERREACGYLLGVLRHAPVWGRRARTGSSW